MNIQSFCERRLQTHKLACELLDKRKQVWALHGQLASLQPYTAEQPLEPLVRQFCQEMIDYISLEHFGIFHHLVNGDEHRCAVLALAEDIFPQMVETTDIALDFNEKFDSISPESLRLELPDGLMALTDALALRIELEDRLVEGMTA
ncbi:MAG: Rsd/AlgQ family anti-sigma factor [Proteobacteria bacterium]|nr:Rsd/AlgQ family anti-sigma factor [Pseudomonadota bacterium]